MDIIIDILVQFIFWFIFWIIVLPILMIFGTPVILLTSIFKKGSYMENIKSAYQKLFKYWKNRI